MKYIVTVGYKDFTFSDGDTALRWAEVAKTHAEDDTAVVVEITKEDDQ